VQDLTVAGENHCIPGVTGRPFHFVNGTDGPPNYTVMRFGHNAARGKIEWHPVGEYMGEPAIQEMMMETNLYTSNYFYSQERTKRTNSSCSLPSKLWHKRFPPRSAACLVIQDRQGSMCLGTTAASPAATARIGRSS
jgi:hypothetical protein